MSVSGPSSKRQKQILRMFPAPLGVDRNRESAVHHAFKIERHRFRVRHLGRARILRHLGMDPIAGRA